MDGWMKGKGRRKGYTAEPEKSLSADSQALYQSRRGEWCLKIE